VAEIVLVHGIGQELASPDTLEADWLLALAGGVLAAGHHDLAGALWQQSAGSGGRMAYYGDLFRRDGPGAEDAVLTAEQWRLAGPLGAEWLRRMAEHGSRPYDRELARQELADLVEMGEARGMQGLIGPMLRSLARIAPFARLGIELAERMVIRALRQISTYFTDDRVRTAAQDRVAALIGPDTRVVIGHSLGAVVAYETVHRLGAPLPMLITLGSPFGGVIHDRLRPQPPHVPRELGHWVNLADTDDVVAAEPGIAAKLPGAAGVLDSDWMIHSGAGPHEASFYLAASQTGDAVASGLLRFY
jgi:hypothetical protein